MIVVKKRILIIALFFIFSCLFCMAQEQNDTWSGTVRFNPADNFINLRNALPGLYITWTHFVLPNLGIPAEIDINFGWGILPCAQISLLSGIEYIPTGIGGNEKSGFFFDMKIGLSFLFDGRNDARLHFVYKTNIGYQLITKKGFVFTPGIGFVYNGHNGFGLNLMLDLGFAYR
ncbi:MAG: hypothetical protein FWC01_02390 [Treponema sp.]|nr:hypothetical protein [Treponema sp.]MCL2237117.1 hypothetical protein [Treponema sp.]